MRIVLILCDRTRKRPGAYVKWELSAACIFRKLARSAETNDERGRTGKRPRCRHPGYHPFHVAERSQPRSPGVRENRAGSERDYQPGGKKTTAPEDAAADRGSRTSRGGILKLTHDPAELIEQWPPRCRPAFRPTQDPRAFQDAVTACADSRVGVRKSRYVFSSASDFADTFRIVIPGRTTRIFRCAAV
jgi:hypothetical protein